MSQQNGYLYACNMQVQALIYDPDLALLVRRTRTNVSWRAAALEIFRKRFKLTKSRLRIGPIVHAEAVLDMVVDQLAFRITDRVFDGVQLLRQIETASFGGEHGQHRGEMTMGAF